MGADICQSFLHAHLTSNLYFQILSQDMLKKYITYSKLNVFPKLHDADLDKLTHVYAELRRESSVRYLPSCLSLKEFLFLS